MTVTLASFRVHFPEFEGASDSLVQAKLDEAALALDERVFGARFDEAVRYLAAHRLALSPFGQTARMVAKDGSTTYGETYAGVQRACAGGAWCVGQLP
jgi:hypothetical protein